MVQEVPQQPAPDAGEVQAVADHLALWWSAQSVKSIKRFADEIARELQPLLAEKEAAVEACRQIKFANDLYEHPNYQHDPDTEWEKALAMIDGVLPARAGQAGTQPTEGT
jgi:hypothetical protein